MKKMLLNLQFIFRPSYWVMIEPYSKELDLLMNDLLDKYEFNNISPFTARLGKIKIWIANQPYACMKPYDYNFEYHYRPSRLTIKRGISLLNKVKPSEEKVKIAEIMKLRKLAGL